jgi:hypothetical protein
LKHGSPLYWEEGEEEVDQKLTFCNYRTASLLTLYWSIQTLLFSALSTLHTSLLQTHTLQHLPLNDPRTSRFLEVAPSSKVHWLESLRNILSSVQYCMRESVGSATPPAGIAVALEIVIDILGQKREEERMRGSNDWLGVSSGGCKVELDRALAAREEIGRRWVAIMLA